MVWVEPVKALYKKAMHENAPPPSTKLAITLVVTSRRHSNAHQSLPGPKQRITWFLSPEMRSASAEWGVNHRPAREVTGQGCSSKHWRKPVSSGDFHRELAWFELFYGWWMTSLNNFGHSNGRCNMGAQGESKGGVKSLSCFRYLISCSSVMWLAPLTLSADGVGWKELLETTKALVHSCSKVGWCRGLHQLSARYSWVPYG